MGRVSRSRLLLVVALVATVAMVGFDAQPRAGTESAAPKAADEVKLRPVAQDGSTALWPYTSRETRFETLTLPINVVIREDPAIVRAMLTREIADEGLDSDGTQRILPELGGDVWGQTHGATRYTYVHDRVGDDGTWQTEYAQLHVGSYLGSRQHVRLYDVSGEDGRATAIQAHHEHWDWFRLRHTVGSTAAGQVYLEQHFYGVPAVKQVSRERYANGGILDADGWVTVVDVRDRPAVPPGGAGGTGTPASMPGDPGDLPGGSMLDTTLVGLAGLAIAGTLATDELDEVRQEAEDALEQFREDLNVTRGHVLLFGSLATIPLGVRVGGVTVERLGLVTNPKLVVAAFYPVLVVGLPLCAYGFATGLGFAESALVAVLGLLTGVILDYTYLGIEVIPRYVLVQRALLLGAIAVVAAAGTVRADRRWRDNELLAVGILCWLLAVAWPLLDLL
ncbi:hypothetical protein [Haloarchaeobius sp. TZWSO28]|uniref:hypothetical protein n=1 Tax=Haloarchaeobius sp. TZWSO28 TaxID=3446119 RepID=UPI003EBC61B0